MSAVEERVRRIRPRYLAKHRSLIERYAQFGGGAEADRHISGRSFANVYQFYIYAFFLGLDSGKQSALSASDQTSDFLELGKWEPRHIVDHVVISAIALSEFDMVGVEHMGEDGIATEVAKIKYCVEAFANKGFEIVSEKEAQDPAAAGADDFFLTLMNLAD